MTHLYDFTPHYLEIDGFRCHYVDEGQGEPLVLLHGNPTWSFMYREVIRALRADYRVIAPDYIGCGFSDKPSSTEYSYSLQQRASDLEQLLDALGVLGGITLIMHDWGGPIGMTYANRHPQRIARLVALNTSAFLLPRGKRLHWTLRVGRSWPLGVLLIRGLNLMVLAAAHLGSQTTLSREVRRCYVVPYNSWQNRIAVLRFVQDIPLYPCDYSYPVLKKVEDNLGQFRNTPLLLCWGEKDFIFDSDFLQEWIKYFPAAQLHRFHNAAHYILEDAAESIISLLRSFLRKYPQGKSND